MKKAVSAFLSCLLAVQMAPFSAVSAETETSQWERFLKYDLCITDYSALTEEEQELCHFIYDTEQSSAGTVRCERARRTLAHDPKIGERITANQIDYIYGICDWYSESELDDHIYLHCVPDIKFLDGINDYNDYWLDDTGTSYYRSTGENSLSGFTIKYYSEGEYPIYKDRHFPPFFTWEQKSDGTARYELYDHEDPNFVMYGNDYYCLQSDGTAVLYSTQYRRQDQIAAPKKPINEPVVVPEKVDNHTVVAIDSNAFAYSGVTEVQLPETVKYIHANAFKGCKYLNKINIPDDISLIGHGAFSETAFTELKLNAPELCLADNAFEKCEALKSADLNVKTIGERAFASCKELKSLNLGESVEKIGYEAFYGCGLDTVFLPKSLRAVGMKAFNTVLSVEIPPTLEIIGSLPKHRGSGLESYSPSQPVLPLLEKQSCVFNCDCVGNDCVISGYKRSEGAKYADEWGLQFIALDAVKGDVNDDSILSIADAVMLAKYLANTKGAVLTDWKAADLNKNRRLDAIDLTLLLREISQQSSKPETTEPAETTTTTTETTTTTVTTTTTTVTTTTMTTTTAETATTLGVSEAAAKTA